MINKRLTWDKPGEWGIKNYDIKKAPKEIYGALCKLRDYERTGLSPDELKDIKKNGWIPCSEKLPEEPVPETFSGLVEMDMYPEYIVMIDGAEKPTVLNYTGGGEWYRDGSFYNVAAWQPMPEPYKGGKKQEDD